MDNTARTFIHACESGKGWEEVKMYVHSESSLFNFKATDALPGPKVSQVKTIKEYADWMASVVENTGPEKYTIQVKFKAVDKENDIVMIYAVFIGISDYLYIFQFDKESGKIKNLRKI